MRVAAALFADERYRRDLVELLGCVERGHIVEVDPLDAPEVDAWLGGLGTLGVEYRFLLELAIEDAARSAISVQARVVDEPASTWDYEPLRLTLGDAMALLRRPLALLVENKRRDGACLKAVGWRYRRLLERLEDQYRLEIAHGGGLEEMRQQILEQGARLWRQRTFAVFDSDALIPQQPSARSTALGQTCRNAGVSYHRLWRRAAENYLPPAILLGWAKGLSGKRRETHLKRAKAFSRLKFAEQRHHYNMKSGHRGDAKRKDRDLGRALFEKLDEPTMRALHEGFGNAIDDLFVGDIEPALLQQDEQDAEMSALFEALLERA